MLTTFKRPGLVRKAVRSIAAQTYRPLQVVVVEDGSDVGLDEWLKQEHLDDVLYVRHKVNRGLPAARNTGLQLAEGDYVGYLDDDDEWMPTRIEEQVRLLNGLTDGEKRSVGVVYCGSMVRSPDGSTVSVAHPRNNGSLRDAVIRDGPMTLSSTFLFSTAALRKIGGFDESLRSSIDHDVWMSLAVHGYEARALDRPLVYKYETGHAKMTTDSTTRVKGVGDYVKKWRPTYREWFGERAGNTYADRYFVRVIATLAAGKLVEGRFREAWNAGRAVAVRRGQRLYALRNLARQTAAAVVHRFLPLWAVKRLRVLSGRSR